MKCSFVGCCVLRFCPVLVFYAVQKFMRVHYNKSSLIELYSFCSAAFQSRGARFHKLLGKK